MAVAAETMYISADTIPEIAEARARVRQYAWDLIGTREVQQVLAPDELPPVIDALSTARFVLEAAEGSPEYFHRREGLDKDCLRLVAEWFRKKRPEYFPPLVHDYDDQAQDFFSHGLSIRQMTENALRPVKDDSEEVERRVNESVENETPVIARGLGSFALAGYGIRTISECTDKAIKDYEFDMDNKRPHRGYGGYVPEIKKTMIRDIRIDEITGNRSQEQIALPGIYIDHYVIREALRRRGVTEGADDKTGLHGNQLFVQDDLMEFAALLDEVASAEWLVNVFMGEEVPTGFVKDYQGFREEALARQEGLKDLAKTVRNFILDLAMDGFDSKKAPSHVENFVKKLLLEEAKKDTVVAEQMFDEKTVVRLKEVVRLEEAGYHQEAFKLMQITEKEADGGGYCSGGSCGLESVDLNTEIGQEIKVKLKVKDGDTVVKDKERKCKCGAREVYYAYSPTEVKKYCGNCDAFESRQVSAEADE